jgi:hypothetical protein
MVKRRMGIKCKEKNTQEKIAKKPQANKLWLKEETLKQQCQQHAPNIMCHPDKVFQIPCNLKKVFALKS